MSKKRKNVIFRATQIKTYSWDSAQVLLVGNKADMQNERVVSTERGQELAQQLGTHNFSGFKLGTSYILTIFSLLFLQDLISSSAQQKKTSMSVPLLIGKFDLHLNLRKTYVLI